MTIFEAAVDSNEFAGATLAAAQTVLEHHGADGYAEAWNVTSGRCPARARVLIHDVEMIAVLVQKR